MPEMSANALQQLVRNTIVCYNQLAAVIILGQTLEAFFSMSKRLNTFLTFSLRIIAFFAVFIIFLSNLFSHVNIAYDDFETVIIRPYFPRSFVMLAIAAALVFLFHRFSSLLERIDQRLLFAIFSAAYLIFAAYLILNTTDYIRADPRSVFQAALEVKRGDYSSFAKGGYMYIYPHQLGLLVFDLLLSCIAETPAVNFCVNLLLVLGVNFVVWQISKELFEEKLIHLLTLVLCFAFFPQLFFIMFAYGQIPGLFFLALAFFFTLRFCRTNRFSHLAGMLLSIALSVILRKNNLIGGMAIMIFLMLHFIRTGRAKAVVAALAVLVCLFAPGRALQTAFERLSASKLDNGCPNILWMAMGTDIDNRVRGPGWYDHSSFLIHQEADHDAQAAAALGREKLQANLKKIAGEPRKAAVFFHHKFISTWCEPLYQSLWSGPIQMREQPETHTPFLNSLYSDGYCEYLAETGAHFLSVLLYAGVCLFLLGVQKTERGWELILLYFIGGVLFHFFWETKSQYVYPYVFCLLPFAACGIYKTKTLRGVLGLTTPAAK